MNDVSTERLSPLHAHKNGPHGQRWDITVDVYLNCADPVDFDLKTCVETLPNSDARHPTIVFNNYERSGGFNINFQFWDNTGIVPQYRFPKDAAQAIWSQAGGECPSGPPSSIFQDPKVTADGLTLRVVNPNDASVYFYYTLRVTNDDGAHFVEMDPGGVNQNGSTGRW